jgi:hypothetical protein
VMETLLARRRVGDLVDAFCSPLCSDNGTMALSEEFLPHIRQQFVGGVMPVAVCSK